MVHSTVVVTALARSASALKRENPTKEKASSTKIASLLPLQPSSAKIS
jgi:hypothetical protein